LKATELALSGIFVIEPQVFSDNRGFFYESYNQKAFEEAIGRKVHFVQDNHSKSAKGVLRGLHFQDPHPQAKLIRVIQGEVFDVAVDLRKNSATYGRWVGEYLSDSNRRQLWIPEGFAHGFLVLSDTVEFLYKTTDYYHPEAEKCLCWNDPDVNIAWPISGDPVLSLKDSQGKRLRAL
jgi:dTDP-4-dehydrorhamnose 3,5-epimerase